jgi:hypothetical protein
MDANTLGNQVVINAITVGVMRHLKNSKWFPLISKETAALNRFIAVLAAGAAAVGVNYSFDHTTGTLMITGLTTATIVNGIYNWVASFVTQQTIFKATSQNDQTK